MNRISNIVKRKKRRTRKCLDEIRDRSRRKIRESHEPSIKEYQKRIISSTVTQDRLTLQAVFPKAVRSETITRPVLTELKQIQGNSIEVSKDKVEYNDYLPFCGEKMCKSTINLKTKKDHNISISDFEESPSFKQRIFNKQECTDKSSSSIMLFSPNSPKDKPFPSKVIDEDAVTCPTLSQQSPHTSEDYMRNAMYQEFMDELPSFFRQHGSIIQDNIIQNNFKKLHKLYEKSCRQEHEDNVLRCINGQSIKSEPCESNKDIIFGNPMDYIGIEHARQQKLLGQSLSDTSSTLECSSASSARSFAGAVCSMDTVLYETPEYTYYPHKLN